jgi:hypothetical protein
MTPVTIPVVPTVALALLLLHIPPDARSVNVIDEPAQTNEAPVMIPEFGNELTVTAFVAIAVPHRLVTENMIVSIPFETPVTIPPETVALRLLLLHIPPVTVSVKVMNEPTQTLERPVILPAFTDEFTVIVLVAVAVPHKLVTVYMMVSIPAETPVTIPPATVALAFVLLHIPPVTVSVKVMSEPIHTLDEPFIMPAFDIAFTVTVLVAAQPLGIV